MRDFLLSEDDCGFRCEVRRYAMKIEDDDWDAVKRVVRALGDAGHLTLMFPELHHGSPEHPGLTHATPAGGAS